MAKKIYQTVENLIAYLFLGLLFGALLLWLAAKDTVILVANISVWAVGVAFIVCLVIGLVLAVGWSRLRLAIYKRDLAQVQRDTDLAYIEVESARTDLEAKQAAIPIWLGQIGAGRALPDDLASIKSSPYPLPNIKYFESDSPLLGEPLPKLSTLLPKAQRILIAGGQNAGKTTICQWIAHYKLQAGRVIVIDSHAVPARWPVGCEVIGWGRDYDKIEALLRWMLAEMDRRFKEQAQGIVPERGHEIISIVSDEWTLLPEVIKNVERYTTPLLTETRKAGFDFYLAAHDTTVDALGIKGKSGLRKAFDFAVLCDYDLRTEERHTYVNFMKAGRVSEKDNVEYDPPGPFVIRGETRPITDNPLLEELPIWDMTTNDDESEEEESEYMPDDQNRIIELYNNGDSLTKICMQMHGYKNQKRLEAIKAVLRENNLIG